MKKRTEKSYQEQVLEKKFPEADGTVEFIIQFAKNLFGVCDKHDFTTKVDDALRFLNETKHDTDKNKVGSRSSWRKGLKRKRNRKTPIARATFLYFLGEFIVFTQERDESLRKAIEFYYKRKSWKKPKMNKVFELTRVTNDLLELIMFDPSLATDQNRTWERISCISLEVAHSLLCEILSVLGYNDFPSRYSLKNNLRMIKTSSPPRH